MTMTAYCAFLELPPELRNIVYEYVAEQDTCFIKRRLSLKTGYFIGARSGLILANQQISEEYISIVQEVAYRPHANLETWVHDFNFCHLERFVKLRQQQSTTPHANKLVQIHLTVSELANIDSTNYARWLNLNDTSGMDWKYEVEDALSGHLLPAHPPHRGDISLFRRCASDSSRGVPIYEALESWQRRCKYRAYRLRHRNPSRPDKLMMWMGGDRIRGDGYEEIPADALSTILDGNEEASVMDLWIDS